MRRLTLTALVAIPTSVLLACGGGNAPQKPLEMAPISIAPPDAGAPARADAGSDAGAGMSESDDPDIRAMLKKLAVIRGLRPKKPVPGVELGRKELIAKIRGKVEREIPPEAIKREGDAMKLHGFIPTDLDYLDETMKLLEAQLAGFYEPKDGTMYIAGDMDEMNSTATLAHELVHALQDQYWDLKSRSDYKPGESDKQAALACLAEGDATSVMSDVMLKRMKMTALDQSDQDYEDQMRASMNVGPARKVPKAMRTSLVTPYIEGIKFVHALRRSGGFTAVDSAWRDPPSTTEQVLHVEKWRAHEQPLDVAVPTSKALGAGFVLDQADTSGELGLRTAYEEWVPRKDAAEIASGWGGDRGALFIRGDEIASMTHVRYDADSPNRPIAGVFARLKAGLTEKLGKPSVKRADFVCFERADTGPLALRVSGDDLAVSAGPAKRSPKWASSATCATAEAWTREALAH
jgi:hypothetical protein